MPQKIERSSSYRTVSSAESSSLVSTAEARPLAKPTASSCEADRSRYCDSLMADIHKVPTGSAQLMQRAAKLVELAEQLQFCRSEKSTGKKLVEKADRAAIFGARFFGPKIGMGVEMKFGGKTYFTAEKVITVPSQRDMGAKYATPQKKYFDFLMSSLSRTNHYATASRIHLGGHSIRFNKKSGARIADDAELERRKTYAPVWSEMLKHAWLLKPERQDKLVNGFAECLANLPDGAHIETELVQAFGDSFKHLVEALPSLGDPAHPDSVSTRQTDAILLVKRSANHMTPEQTAGIKHAVTEALAREEDLANPRSIVSPLSIELDALLRALDVSAA